MHYFIELIMQRKECLSLILLMLTKSSVNTGGVGKMPTPPAVSLGMLSIKSKTH
jgi:hypothetical protein